MTRIAGRVATIATDGKVADADGWRRARTGRERGRFRLNLQLHAIELSTDGCSAVTETWPISPRGLIFYNGGATQVLRKYAVLK